MVLVTCIKSIEVKHWSDWSLAREVSRCRMSVITGKDSSSRQHKSKRGGVINPFYDSRPFLVFASRVSGKFWLRFVVNDLRMQEDIFVVMLWKIVVSRYFLVTYRWVHHGWVLKTDCWCGCKLHLSNSIICWIRRDCVYIKYETAFCVLKSFLVEND